MESKLPAINGIPYDIFRQIIIYAYTYTPEPYQRGEDFSHIQALAPPLSASHVCSAWRCALLSDMTMWTTLSIPEMNLSGIEELLRRSQSAPLNISLLMREDQMRHYNMSNALSLIFEHIDRFKSLRVYVHVTYHLLNLVSSFENAAPIRQLLEFLQQPAPRLQVFSFRNIGAKYSLQAMFLNTLFSGSAPNLKHINYQVSDIAYRSFSCPLFHGLSELHLSCFDNADLDNVLALLRLSSSLEVLGIFGDRPVNHESPSEGSEPVNLPHLQRLVLEASNSTGLINFINGYLTFPPNVKWDVNMLVGRLFQDLPPLLELIPLVRFTNLHVLFKGSPYTISSDKTIPTDFYQIDDNKMTFSFNESAATKTDSDWSDLLMIHSTAFSSVTHFNFELTPWEIFRKKTFSTIFSVMENLQYLLVKQRVLFYSNHQDQPCLEGLSVLLSSRQDGAKPLCPLLCQITIKLDDSSFDRPCATMLHEARRESGWPLKISVYCPEVWHFGVKSELQMIFQSPLARKTVTDLKVSDIQHQTLSK